jgi:8-oxo-dGTP pyrophosphatase MutT (NUDIX family)
MSKASRAIIIDNDKILVMHRNKQGSQYFTLVGGRVNDDESTEQAVIREVKEETGLDVVSTRLVFIEEHAAPYNQQYIYLCEVRPHQNVAIQETSEEGLMNRIGINTHQPFWAETRAFPRLPFRTPQLQKAICDGLKKGFPDKPVIVD